MQIDKIMWPTEQGTHTSFGLHLGWKSIRFQEAEKNVGQVKLLTTILKGFIGRQVLQTATLNINTVQYSSKNTWLICGDVDVGERDVNAVQWECSHFKQETSIYNPDTVLSTTCSYEAWAVSLLSLLAKTPVCSVLHSLQRWTWELYTATSVHMHAPPLFNRYTVCSL